jgi:hypothetical protein
MIERRALERIEIDQLAMLHVDGVCGVHPCKLENFHDQGAKLQSSAFHIAAFEFDLSLDGFKTTRRCHVTWRGGNTCGVEFVELNPTRAAKRRNLTRAETATGRGAAVLAACFGKRLLPASLPVTRSLSGFSLNLRMP